MSEVREVLERVFESSDQASGLVLAALWSSVNPDVSIETIVGDAEFVYVYYRETMTIPKTDFGIVPPSYLPSYTLKGSAG